MPALRLRRRQPRPTPRGSTPATATLDRLPPAPLEVGVGTVLSVGGSCSLPAGQVRTCELHLGQRHAPVLVHESAPDGCRWSGLIEIGRLGAGERATPALEVLLRDGTRQRLELPAIDLVPGSPVVSAIRPESRRVAICLATHDPPLDLLSRQIESIRAQSHEDWICIVSDDDSPPQKWEATVEIVDDDERFHLSRSESRLGFYRNFERALKAVPAEVPYVALCDQDDHWHPDKLATLVAALSPTDVLAHSDARVVARDGSPIAAGIWPGRIPRDDELRSLLLANAVTGASCLIRREVLDHALPFPALAGTPFHDRWIALVASQLGGVTRIDRPLFDYVQHDAASLGHLSTAGGPGGGSAGPGVFERWRSGELERSWRAEYLGPLLRTVGEAIAIRMRMGGRMSAPELRASAALERLGRSVRTDGMVFARAAGKRARGGPGLEAGLARGILWRRLAGTIALPRGGGPSQEGERASG